MSGRRLLNRLAGERLVRVVDTQITRTIEAAYEWLLTHQLEHLAERFRQAGDELEELARERHGEAA